MVVGCAKEKFWQRLTRRHRAAGVGRPTRAFATFADRDRNRDVLLPAARGDLRAADRRRVAASCCAAVRSRAAPINDVAAALTEPHTAARDLRRRDRAPALRHGPPGRLAGARRVRAARRTAARRSATRTSTASSARCSGYDDAAVADLAAAARSGRRGLGRRPRPRPPPDDRRTLAAWALRRVDVPADGARRRARGTCSTALGTAIAAAALGTRPARRCRGGARARRAAGGDPARRAAYASARRPPRSRPARSCTPSTSTTPTPAGWCTPPPSCCRPRSRSASRSARPAARCCVAAVVGYETVCRIAGAAPHGFHAARPARDVACGVFSSALVAARLMRPRPPTTRRTRSASPGARPAGCWSSWPPAPRPSSCTPASPRTPASSPPGSPRPAPTGPATVFEGEHGLYAALATGPADRASHRADGLGVRWETTRIGIKPYPACQLIARRARRGPQALRRATASRRRRRGIDVDVHPDSRRSCASRQRDLARPASPYDAKFSLPWSVAALLARRRRDHRHLRARLARPARGGGARPAGRAWTVTGDGPAADAAGAARVTLVDGRTVTGAVQRSAGGPDTPLSDAQLDAKFLGNAGRRRCGRDPARAGTRRPRLARRRC